jgi:putative endopeptidase
MKKACLGLVVFVLAVLPLGAGAQSGDGSDASQTGDSTSVTLASPPAGGCAGFLDSKPDAPSHGFDLANLDRSVKPCDDFFQFADGGWIKANPIPAAYPGWGSFNRLAERNEEVLRQILEDAAKNTKAPANSAEQKIGDFYASCMNTERAESEGARPLLPEFERISKIQNLSELQAEVARLQTLGVDALFQFGSRQDFKNSSQEIAQAAQGGLGLPDRDYYTKADEKTVKQRDAYVQHVGKMFELLGDDAEKAAAEAKTVVSIETKLAEASLTRVERRDPDKNYHKMDLAQLKTLTPQFSWESYFHDVGYPRIDAVNVGQPDFFKQLDQSLTAIPLPDWKTYLRWHLIHTAAPRLSTKFVDEDFDFYGRTMTGTKEILPRWKRCVQVTDRELGEALGQIYVQKAFSPEAKARALEMVHNLIAALRDDLSTLDWMGPETRKQALTKLDAITLKIGYPDKWRDYSAFHVDRGPYVANFLRGREFEFHRELDRIGKPVDRTEWGMTPPTVNAYYSAPMNEIVFPAGILQPPFYDPHVDDALNYGGMGAVIGHELTHGFDDQGRKFDAQGNLKDWWTADDAKNFQERADCVSKQFDSFVVEEGLHENGKLVLGESIADLGGLTIAHAALAKVWERNPQQKEIDGFTPDQRFFLAWAQIWASSNRPEFARLIVATNPHPLGRFRTIGPLSNMPAFSKAFGCNEGEAMVRPAAERCRIW